MNDTDFVTWLSELRPTVAACMDWLQNAINRFVGSVLKLNLIYLILLLGAFGFAAIYVVRFISNIKMSKGSYESGYTNGSYSSGLSPKFRNVSFLRFFTGRGKLNVATPGGKDSSANYSSINGIKYQSSGSMSSKYGGSSKGGKFGGKNSSGGYGTSGDVGSFGSARSKKYGVGRDIKKKFWQNYKKNKDNKEKNKIEELKEQNRKMGEYIASGYIESQKRQSVNIDIVKNVDDD